MDTHDPKMIRSVLGMLSKSQYPTIEEFWIEFELDMKTYGVVAFDLKTGKFIKPLSKPADSAQPVSCT